MSESNEVKIARLEEQIKTLFSDLKDKISRSEFEPIKILVYGVTGLFLMSVVGAIIKVAFTGG
jgi:hypothetical protein